MPRLVQWPIDLRPRSQEPVAGPSAISGGTPSLTGHQQTVSSPFGSWQWDLKFAPMQGEKFRRFRGFFAAMQQGANATRWTPSDPDRISRVKAGMVTNVPNSRQIELPHSNGKFHTNGRGHIITLPPVLVAAAAAKGDVIVKLAAPFWGHVLDYGDFLGFFPFHFGAYIVTERIAPGEYRVWPPLRKEIKPTDYATLYPTMVVRMRPGTGGGLVRDPDAAQGMQMVVQEIRDEDVRAFYTG